MGLAVLARQSITSLSSATTLTVPAGAQFVHLQAIDQNVRFTQDGTTTPTSSVGQVLYAGDPPSEYSAQEMRLADLQFIEEASGAKLEVEYRG